MGKSTGEGTGTKQTQTSTQPKMLMVVIIIAVLVIAVLVGVIVFLMTRPADEPATDRNSNFDDSRATVLTEDNVDEVMSQVREPVTDGYYNCQMNVEWNFASSTEPSYNAYVANSTINTRTVYFDVNLDEDGTLVYSSPYIPVGAELREFALTEELPAGDYPATVTYHLVDDDHQELSTVSVLVTLHIEQ